MTVSGWTAIRSLLALLFALLTSSRAIAATSSRTATCSLLRTIRSIDDTDKAALGEACVQWSIETLPGARIPVHEGLRQRLITQLPFLDFADSGAIIANVDLSTADAPTPQDFTPCREAVVAAASSLGDMERVWTRDAASAALACPGRASDERTLVFALSNDESLTVVVAHSDGSGTTVTVGPGALAAPHGHERLIAVNVPKDAPYVYRTAARGLGQIRYGTAFADLVLRAEPAQTRCVQLSVAMRPDPSRGLFFDGEPLNVTAFQEALEHHAVVSASVGKHSFVAMVGDKRVVDQVLDVRAFSPTDGNDDPHCQAERFDAAGARRFSVEKISVSPSCEPGFIDEDDIRSASRAFLKARLDAQFFDRPMTQAVLEDFERSLGPEGRARDEGNKRARPASRRGASRSIGDPSIRTRGILDELRRQGVSDVLVVNVHCSGSRESSVATFEVSRFHLGFDLVDDGATRGLRLDRLDKTQVETAPSAEVLHFALTAALSRSIGLPYARFSGSRREQHELEYTDQLYETYGLHSDVEVSDHRITDGKQLTECTDLDNRDRLRGHEPAFSSKVDTLVEDRTATRDRRSVGFSQVSAGVYKLTLKRTDNSAVLDERCVVVRRPDMTVWGDATFSMLSHSKFTGASTSRVRGGVRFTQSEAIDFGPMVGLAYTTFEYAQPPTWDAVVAGVGTAAGETSRWTKTSIALGAAWDVRLLDKHVFGGYARISPSILIGYIDAGRLPAGVRTFDRRDSPSDGAVDVDLGLDATLLFRFPLGSHLEFDVGYGASFAGADDLTVELFDLKAEPPSTIHSDPVVSIGIVAGLGWSL